MKKPSIEDLKRAAAQLGGTGRGRQAMVDLLVFLENGGISLDADNQQAARVLLAGAWGEYAGTAREVMREAAGIEVATG